MGQFSGHSAAERDRAAWDELKSLAGAEKVREFYERYAGYLEREAEESRVVSDRRAVLIKMAKLAASKLG